MRSCIASGLLLLAACDAHYTVHLRGRVGGPSGPLAGAWVVPLQAPESAARTRADGSVALDHGGFLRNTSHSEILVVAPGHRAQLLVPGRDVALRERGLFLVTEWDETLVATLAPLGPEAGLRVQCDQSACTAVMPATDPLACQAYAVVLGPDAVWRGAPAPGPGVPAGDGARLQRVPLPERIGTPAQAMVVSECRPSAGGAAQFSLSDRVTLTPGGR